MLQRCSDPRFSVMHSFVNHLSTVYLTGEPVVPSQAELTTLRQWIRSQFRQIPCHVLFVDQEINLADALTYLKQTGTLKVSTLYSDHPYLSAADNAKFRAVHDWHHFIGNHDDSLNGEIGAYLIACQSAPEAIKWILHSEIVLQAAACLATGSFQAQKLVKGGF